MVRKTSSNYRFIFRLDPTHYCRWTSQVALVVKNLPTNAGDLRDSGSNLDWEDSLEGIVTCYSILEGWAPKNWCFWTVVLEKTLESPLDCKGNQPVHSEGDQPWVFFGRNDAKAETPVLWPPHAKSWFIGKDSDAGRDWGQEEKGMTEDEMAGWHYWLDGRESGWTPGVGDEQGALACCDSWGRKESDTTEWLNWTELTVFLPGESHGQRSLAGAHSVTKSWTWLKQLSMHANALL